MIPSLVALLIVAQPIADDGGVDGGVDAGVSVIEQAVAPDEGFGFSAPREPLSPYSWDVVGCEASPGVLLPAMFGLFWLVRRRGAR